MNWSYKRQYVDLLSFIGPYNFLHSFNLLYKTVENACGILRRAINVLLSRSNHVLIRYHNDRMIGSCNSNGEKKQK